MNVLIKVLLLKFLLVVLSTPFFAEANRRLLDGVIAVVNNEYILESDLRLLQDRLKRPEFFDETLLFDMTMAELSKDRSKKIDFLVRERILDSEIKRLNLSVTSDRVEQEIREVARRYRMDRDQLFQAVRAQGITPSEYQEITKRRLQKSALVQQEISPRVQVRDEDVISELSRRGVQNIQVFENTVHHIFFNPRHNPAKSEQPAAEALRRAQSALARLQRGERFLLLADQISEDPSHQSQGKLGQFKTGELSSELDQAVARLQVGEFSNIVRSRQGFHILYLADRKISMNASVQRQMSEVQSQLIEKTFQKVFLDWIEQKKAEIFFKVF